MLLDTEDLYIGPMGLLELQYLFKIGKIAFDGKTILDQGSPDSRTLFHRRLGLGFPSGCGGA